MANRIQGTTRLLGLIGNPIKHSRSPHMHNSAFEKTGLDYVYLCIEKPEGTFEEALDAMKKVNAVGGNITFPHKQIALKYVDEVSEDARRIGAVNTYKIDDETKKVTTYNTDGRGFIASLDYNNIPYKDKKVVLLGFGGAGRAIAVNLALNGVKELIIKDVSKESVDEMIDIMSEGCDIIIRSISMEEELAKELKDASLLINATPVGMSGNEDQSPVNNVETLNSDCFVYDIIYQPQETKLMRMAKKAGCETCNGIDMMIWQGAIAFNIWTGMDMPIDYVKQELFKGEKK